MAIPTDSLIQSARQQATRQWWDDGYSGLDLVTSLETLDEAGRGDPEMAEARLELLDSIAVLPVTDIAVELAENLVKTQIVDDRYSSDAIHIAVCAAHAVDYLITWNFKHIANPFLRDRIRKEVEKLGLLMPVMCSPEEILQTDADD